MILLDAAGINQILDRMTEQILQEFTPESETVMVGVRTRGVPLAQRLASRLAIRSGKQIPVGSLDITLYRDDLNQRKRWPQVRRTAIPFPIEDRRVILVDDVLFTGRTIIAAIAALADLGRPSAIRLAVLIDRGHREFPIQADFLGHKLDTSFTDRINVKLQESDQEDCVVVM